MNRVPQPRIGEPFITAHAREDFGEKEAIELLRKFMCCKAGQEAVDAGLIRPFLHSLPYVPEDELAEERARLEGALESIAGDAYLWQIGEGPWPDAAALIEHLRKTAQAAV